jgi:hypothetical protein
VKRPLRDLLKRRLLYILVLLFLIVISLGWFAWLFIQSLAGSLADIPTE